MEWITLAIQTITPKHRDLRQICIHFPYNQAFAGGSANVEQTIGGAICDEWLALDCAFVQLWESRSIRLEFTYIGLGKEKEMSESIDCLLPETTKRRIINR